MQTAIIYTRVSSEKQIENTSLDSQEEAAMDFCKRNNVQVLKLFREEGESAKTTERTKLKEALEYISINKPTYLIIFKIDRLSRNRDDYGALKALISSYGTQIYSLSEKIENTPQGRFMESIFASVAQLDNEERSDKATRGIKVRLKEGYWFYNIPTGYLKPDTSDKFIRMVPIPDTNTFNLIKHGWQMLFEEFKMSDVKDFLERNGLELEYKALAKIYRNPFYAGLVIVDALGIESIGKWEPMITKDMYEIVQYKLNHKDKANSSKVNLYFSLQRLIKCKECDCVLSPSRSRGKLGKVYEYYECSNSTKCLKRQRVKKKEAEEDYMKYLDEVNPLNNHFNLFKDIVIERYEEKYGHLLKEIDNKEKLINQYEGMLNRAKELLFKGVISEEEYNEAKGKYNQKIVLKKVERSEISITRYDLEEALNIIETKCKDLSNSWYDLLPQSKLQLNEVFFPDGLQYENRIYRTSENISETNVLMVMNSVQSPMVGAESFLSNTNIFQGIVNFANQLQSLLNPKLL